MARLLVIAGSDSSAGAGLQADLKTAQAFQVYAQTAVTAVTVQDTNTVHAVHAVTPVLVRAQIEAALNDIGADAIKIGMLANGAIAGEVARALDGAGIPVVIDPVLVSSSGAQLLDDAGIEVLLARLFPRAALVTPNLPEAERLSGTQDVSEGANRLLKTGAKAVLIKGGHGEGDRVRDLLFESGGRKTMFEAPRQKSRHTHGTGCVLATAIACGLAQGKVLPEAVRLAHQFVQEAIRAAPGLGAGRGPLGL
jgi:hydroxymethylpyrimidine/phosphomethylpyrimidine kinase